ncbi:5936_t:CDS:1, partial [Dentiscutata erythropus]
WCGHEYGKTEIKHLIIPDIDHTNATSNRGFSVIMELKTC